LHLCSFVFIFEEFLGGEDFLGQEEGVVDFSVKRSEEGKEQQISVGERR
jgi:hypothetical protein